MGKNSNEQKSNGQIATPFAQTYFHWTRSDLKLGEFIEVGFNSNYDREKMQNIFFYQQH